LVPRETEKREFGVYVWWYSNGKAKGRWMSEELSLRQAYEDLRELSELLEANGYIDPEHIPVEYYENDPLCEVVQVYRVVAESQIIGPVTGYRITGKL
jgi:hypothetical protein